MSVVTLSHQNFSVVGTHQKTLCTNLRNVALIFFKMDGCDNCAQFSPIFFKLAKTDNRVSYAILNITQNKDVVIWSRQTSTPINTVPTLILYINGKPHARFNGTKNIPSLQSFITQALATPSGAAPMPAAAPQQQFMAAPPPQNIYGGQPPQNKQMYMPDIGPSPSMKNMIKGGTGVYPGGAGYVEAEDENLLLAPDTVVPWNKPWETEMQ
jgi:hypothetical protein